MQPIRPNHDRARVAIILVWLSLILEVIGFASGYLQYDLLLGVQNGMTISEETANNNDLREQAVAVLALIVFIISIITFLRWFGRASFNLHRITDRKLSHTEGWAVGCWFVPIISLYQPYQITKEMYEETRRLLAERNGARHLPISISFLGWWWSFWILNNLVGQFVFRYSMRAETIDELIFSTQASLVGNLVGIPLAILAVKVIRDYSRMEDELYATPVKTINDNQELTS